MTSPILLADGNAARAQRLIEACAERGLEASHAGNGAQALEMALADVPDVVVATVDLGLIDGVRLADILRANPRTRDARFIFLGGEGATFGGVFDEALSPQTTPEQVAARVEAALHQRARVDAVQREAAADHEVQGSLVQIPLTDLLQLFHMNRRTGTLELTRREPGGEEERGTISLREGSLLRATTGCVEGEKALFRLLGWTEGSFAFNPTRVTGSARIHMPTRALLLEGVRQLDESQRLRDSLPSMDATIVVNLQSQALPEGVHPLTEAVVRQLGEHDVVRDLVDACPWPDYQVLRTLQALVERNIVSLRRRTEAPLSGQTSLFAPEQLRRLRDWLQAGRPRGARPTEAKLAVISADPGATRDFAGLLEGLPGATLTEAFRSGSFRDDDVLPMGRLAVGDGFGLDFLHVPGRREFAPLWPVATHGALGTLLIAAGDLAEAEASLQAAARAVSQRPRARVFHVLLLRKSEKVDAAELQERLSLLDEASLFLLQLESDRPPAERMRTMLGRVMP